MMPHFDWTFRISDVFVMCGALGVVGRLMARSILRWRDEVDAKLALHDRALERAGWLKRNRRGQFEVPAQRESV